LQCTDSHALSPPPPPLWTCAVRDFALTGTPPTSLSGSLAQGTFIRKLLALTDRQLTDELFERMPEPPLTSAQPCLPAVPSDGRGLCEQDQPEETETQQPAPNRTVDEPASADRLSEPRASPSPTRLSYPPSDFFLLHGSSRDQSSSVPRRSYSRSPRHEYQLKPFLSRYSDHSLSPTGLNTLNPSSGGSHVSFSPVRWARPSSRTWDRSALYALEVIGMIFVGRKLTKVPRIVFGTLAHPGRQPFIMALTIITMTTHSEGQTAA
uniref:PRRT3 n=1 Tax=Schistocephalus solidus TaxID=70667 RepID=A0A183TIA5_SCHSO